jgi:putative oxidoreductase
MKIGRLLLRVAVGGFFFGHGTQKLFGWFGGNGLDATAQGFEALGLRPGRRNAIAAGVAEAGGGALLASGLATPLAASALTATMLTAIETVHAKNGPWLNNGGYEYNVVMIAAVLTLAEGSRGRSGSRSAAAALLAGALGALGARRAAASQSVPPAPATESSDAVEQEIGNG